MAYQPKESKREYVHPDSYVHPEYSEEPVDFEMEQSTDLRITQRTYAIYLQDQVSFSAQWKLLLGARADWVNDKQDNYIKDKKTDENNLPSRLVWVLFICPCPT